MKPHVFFVFFNFDDGYLLEILQTTLYSCLDVFFLHSKVGSTHLSGQRKNAVNQEISANLTKDQKPMTRRLVHELDDSKFS